MVKDENITADSKKKFLSFRMFKKRRQKGFFRALLCCFRPEVTQGIAHKPSKEIGPELENYSLLPQSNSCDSNKLCLVIDLDETLVHSSFRPTDDADFVIPIDIDGNVHSVYVLKRPYVDEFLQSVGKLYECVLFTASLAEYADPVANLLDQWGVFKWRLFRDSCVFFKGGYVKDLGKLGRDLRKVVIIDNSPASYCFHRNNAVPIASWFEDTSDTQLRDLIPFFEKLSTVDNVYSVLKNSDKGSTELQNITCSESKELINEPMNVTSPISNIPHP